MTRKHYNYKSKKEVKHYKKNRNRSGYKKAKLKSNLTKS